MRDVEYATVTGKGGLRGVLLDPVPSAPTGRDAVRVQLDGGSVIKVPAQSLEPEADGTWLMPFGPDEFASRDGGAARSADTIVPVIAEELVVDKERVPTGGVRVTRRVLEHEENVELPLFREHVDVRRVLVGRPVDGPLPIRREGDTTIIPVVEEEVVIQKRYILKEEVHVIRSVREEIHRERVPVRHQEPVIERLDSSGRSRVEQVAEASPPSRPRRPRRSILGED